MGVSNLGRMGVSNQARMEVPNQGQNRGLFRYRNKGAGQLALYSRSHGRFYHIFLKGELLLLYAAVLTKILFWVKWIVAGDAGADFWIAVPGRLIWII
jgi:hypothetical protein